MLRVVLLLLLAVSCCNVRAQSINVTATWIAGTSSANSLSAIGTFGVPSTTIYPGGRVMPCLAITVADTNYKIYIYGGQGYSTGAFGYQKDFWSYNLATSEWTMLAENPTNIAVTGTRGVENSTTFPGGFGRSACLINPRDNYLYMFGGVSGPRYNDMWRYNLTSGYWAWLGGGTGTTPTINTESSTIFPSTRRNAAMVAHPSLNILIMMSGFGADLGGFTTGDMNDMWKFNLDTNAWTWFAGNVSSLTVSSVFDTKLVYNSANFPGGRNMHTTWIHPTTYAMYMFGGLTGTGAAYFNDMWSYDFASGYWKWISGGPAANQLPVFGISAVFNDTYTPGARASAIFSKVYGTTYLSLYGGRGYGVNSAAYNANLNEMWMFDYSVNQWAWIVGANETNTYGTMGVPSSGPYPQGRNLYGCAPLAFQKSSIIFGGLTGAANYLDDMWKLDFSVYSNATTATSSASSTASSVASTRTAIASTTTIVIGTSASSTLSKNTSISSTVSSITSVASTNSASTSASLSTSIMHTNSTGTSSMVSQSVSLASSSFAQSSATASSTSPSLSISIAKSTTTSNLVTTAATATTITTSGSTATATQTQDPATNAPIVAGLEVSTMNIAIISVVVLVVVIIAIFVVMRCCMSAKPVGGDRGGKSNQALTGDANKSAMMLSTVYGSPTTMANAATLVMEDTEFAMPGFLQFQAGRDFRWETLLAKGGGGEIYIGQGFVADLRKNSDDGRIIVKIVAPMRSVISIKASQAFDQEIAVMHHLGKHRNISQMLGWCEEPLAIVMKFYRSGDLRGFIKAGMMTTKCQINLFAKDICGAVQYMHSKGVAHRDIKAENVFIDQDEFGGAVCVLGDFGIANIFSKHAGLVGGFNIANLHGLTISYSAPEVIYRFRMRSNDVDMDDAFRGDIFSFAMLLYFLLNKKEAWTR